MARATRGGSTLSEQEASASKGRRTAFTVLTIVAGAGLGLGAFAFPSLLFAWFGVGGREVHRIHDLAWGAHAGLLIALPLLLQARGPERKPAAMQTAALGVVALVIANTISTSLNLIAAVAVVLIAALWWLHPARGELLRPGSRIRPAMAILVLVTAIPLKMYALDQAELQRACSPAAAESAVLMLVDEHCEELHFSGMAALSFALVLVGLLGSAGTRGWPIPAFGVGAAAIVIGVASILFPDAISSFGTRWGTAAVVGGLAYLSLAQIARRRGT